MAAATYGQGCDGGVFAVARGAIKFGDVVVVL